MSSYDQESVKDVVRKHVMFMARFMPISSWLILIAPFGGYYTSGAAITFPTVMNAFIVCAVTFGFVQTIVELFEREGNQYVHEESGDALHMGYYISSIITFALSSIWFVYMLLLRYGLVF